MKRVLVTGATGFIGNYVIHDLLRKGYTVIASSPAEDRARLQAWFRQVEYIPLDLSAISPDADYFEFFRRPDSMIHLAWEGLPNYKAAFHLEDNLPRHSSFLTSLIRGGLKDLTVTGTCLEYGLQEGCLSEEMAVCPSNPYSIAKNELRLFLEKLQGQYPFVLKWVRLFYMYGKGQNPNSLFSQLDKALANHDTVFNMSGGQQVRDYLPVETVAHMLAQIASQQKVQGIVNCCSGNPITVREMVENYIVRRQQSISLNFGYYPYPDYEPFRFWGDVSKLKSIL